MEKLVTCNHCNAEHKLEDILREREVRTDLLEVGLLCTCGIWTHSYFINAELKQSTFRMMELLTKYQDGKNSADWQKYEMARDVHRGKFQAFNHRWRRKFRMLG